MCTPSRFREYRPARETKKEDRLGPGVSLPVTYNAGYA